MSSIQMGQELGFVLRTGNLGVAATQYEVEVIGTEAFVHFTYSDGKPIVITGAPLPVAMQIAASAGTGLTVSMNFTSKRLMDVGEATEHWCASFLGCKFKPSSGGKAKP